MYRDAPSSLAPLILSAAAGRVVAYSRTEGRTVWTYGPEELSRSADPRPTQMEIRGARVFLLVGRLRKKVLGDKFSAELTALHYDTGRVLWSEHMEREAFSFRPTLFADDDQVVVCHDGLLRAFAADTGAVKWSRRAEPSEGDHHPDMELGVPGYTAGRRLSD